MGLKWDMLYSPTELAELIGINCRQFYFVYIPAGCPHEKDERGYYWINGIAFREWYNEVFKEAKDRRETRLLQDVSQRF